MKDLHKLLQRYGSMPDFKGIDLHDVNQAGLHGDAPLHLAAASGNVDDVMLLLASGARINAVGSNGNTALHHAALHGHAEALQILLEYGECSYTLVSVYDRMNYGDPDQGIALDTGANVYWQNEAGDTPLHCAAACGRDKCLEQLLEVECFPSDMDALGPSHVRNNAGCAPLLCAAATGTPEGLLGLLMVVGEQYFADSAGRNMLHLAVTRPDYDQAGRRIMRLVIDKASNEKFTYVSEVHWRDNYGNSPLHAAASVGNLDAIEILLRSGAVGTLDALNDQGHSPMALAAQNGMTEAELLIKAAGGALCNGKERL